MVCNALTVAACGGSVGDTSTSPSTPTGVQDSNIVPPQTSVPEPTYATSSVPLSLFRAINAARQAYGLGLFAQSAALDTAATNHAQYLLQRWQAGDTDTSYYFSSSGSVEAMGNPGFTGRTSFDRASAANYLGDGYGESNIVVVLADGVPSDPGTVAVNKVLSLPYHRFGLFGSWRDVGIGVANTRVANPAGTVNIATMSLGWPKCGNSSACSHFPVLKQFPSPNWVGVWPLDGATNVMYAYRREAEADPMPDSNGNCAGYPVSIQAMDGVLTSSFTLTETMTNTPVDVLRSPSTATPSTTPYHDAYAGSGVAIIIPYKPLKLGTRYTAHFVGSLGSMAIDKTWTFTTGTTNTKAVYGCDPSS